MQFSPFALSGAIKVNCEFVCRDRPPFTLHAWMQLQMNANWTERMLSAGCWSAQSESQLVPQHDHLS
ncbi:hypothetical protein H6F67_03465 [Microcoleus sp. FACHB-1515]|uniref:hypothetical protein n=1 Tax=Cyanophyceae TaxID=3028117 RepID=UPI001689F69E|nr:hypothetical protein [Microcoleus sp. FACHB-1515]MBD2088909.1 hypothetical protein [Microcoleus sp. FACHB-1515]